MIIRYHGESDRGKVRKANEDYFAYKKLPSGEHLFVVADGMGGHQAGDVASKLGTVTFINSFRSLRSKDTPIIEALNSAIEEANTTILNKSKRDLSKRGMGTTFSALCLADMRGYIVHVGDSRVYLVRDREILRLTKDHTFVEKMIEDGKLTAKEAREHPQRNILYMSLGAHQYFSPEVIEEFALKEGDVFILCSDGLNNMVSEETIKQMVLSHSLQETVTRLIALANDNGGTDNITVQAVGILKPGESDETEPLLIVKKPGLLRRLVDMFRRKGS